MGKEFVWKRGCQSVFIQIAWKIDIAMARRVLRDMKERKKLKR